MIRSLDDLSDSELDALLADTRRRAGEGLPH
jgi:hypothetical protein